MKRIIISLCFWVACLWATEADLLVDSGDKEFNDKNYSKAIEIYKQACGLNSASGCYKLSKTYINGHGGLFGFTEAKNFFEKMCDLNKGAGCRQLAELYYYGYGVSQDYAKTKAYYEKACDLNESTACYLRAKLAFGEENILGGEIPTKLFLKKACDLGFKLACFELTSTNWNMKTRKQPDKISKNNDEHAKKLTNNININENQLKQLYAEEFNKLNITQVEYLKNNLFEIIKIIGNRAKYPEGAIMLRKSGRVTASFLLSEENKVSDLRTLKSSGASGLDYAMLETIKNTSKDYPPPPETIKIIISISYILK